MRKVAAWFLGNLAAVPVAWWVRCQERKICAQGTRLRGREVEIARCAGVRRPDLVRVLAVDEVPFPLEGCARVLARICGQFPVKATGLTAYYGIYLQRDLDEDRLAVLAHELVHTGQYERLGGILAFIREYLRDCLANGYMWAAMEEEARTVGLRALEDGG